MKSKSHQRKHWSPERKLKAVSDTFSASETEVGAYLRKEGLYTTQLDEWKTQMLASVSHRPKQDPALTERDEKIKQLERELLRKDKALAEASALLILQKKINLIWGYEEAK